MAEYKTISGYSTQQCVEKKSVFIGHIMPVTCKEEAVDFINRIKSEHHDARHNVFAYILKNGEKRYSDDSEPQGTAGLPILDLIEKYGLVDVCIVVTRYFGGVLLGTGGLVRAYSKAATLAIESAESVVLSSAVECEINCNYTQYGKISALLDECCAVGIKSDFSDDIRLSFIIKDELLSAIEQRITDITCGNCRIVVKKHLYAKF